MRYNKISRFIRRVFCTTLLMITTILIHNVIKTSKLIDEVGKMRMLSESLIKESLITFVGFQNHSSANGLFKSHFKYVKHSIKSEKLCMTDIRQANIHFNIVIDEYANFHDTPVKETFITYNDAIEFFIKEINDINIGLYEYVFINLLIICGLLSGISLYIFFLYYKTRANAIKIEYTNKAINKTLSQICHEARTHIACIKIGLEYANETQSKNTTIATALIACNSLDNVLRNRLEISKVLSGKYTPNKQQVNISHVIQEVISEKKTVIKNKYSTERLFLFHNLSEVDLWIETDEYFISRAIHNIIDNAIKKTPTGTIEINVKAFDKEVQIRIIDSGCGISVQDQKTLFSNNNNNIHDVRSFGMGLFFVTSITNALNGYFKLERSELGVGSTFLIGLFTSWEYSKPDEQISIVVQELPNNKNILIIDDQDSICKIVASLFKRISQGLDWDVKTGNTGEEALAIISYNTDLILIDQNMESAGGTLKGTETIQQMRKNGFRGLIVLCSGDDDIVCPEADTIWTKPIPPINKIKEFLLAKWKP